MLFISLNTSNRQLTEHHWVLRVMSLHFSAPDIINLLFRFYWIDPLAYAQKGLAVNEFQAPRWKHVFVSGPGSQSVGDAVLGQRGLPTYDYERWLAIGVLIFAWIVFNLITWACYVYLSGDPLWPVLEFTLVYKSR